MSFQKYFPSLVWLYRTITGHLARRIYLRRQSRFGILAFRDFGATLKHPAQRAKGSGLAYTSNFSGVQDGNPRYANPRCIPRRHHEQRYSSS